MITRLTAQQLERLDRKSTVILFPVQALEDFGPHLPIDTGLEISEFLCRELGKKLEAKKPGWTSVLWLKAPLGVSTNTTSLSFQQRPHVLRDYLVDTSLALSRAGFQYFVAVTHHLGPKHLTAIEEAGQILRAKTRLSSLFGYGPEPRLFSVSSAWVTSADVKRSPFFPDPKEHAGALDTSFGLLLEQQNSNFQMQPQFRSLPPTEQQLSLVAKGLQRFNRKTKGYLGAPSAADPLLAEKQIQTWMDEALPKLLACLSEDRQSRQASKRIFRSWYSVIPSNGSFFRSWILAGMLGLVLIFWVLLWLGSATS